MWSSSGEQFILLTISMTWFNSLELIVPLKLKFRSPISQFFPRIQSFSAYHSPLSWSLHRSFFLSDACRWWRCQEVFVPFDHYQNRVRMETLVGMESDPYLLERPSWYFSKTHFRVLFGWLAIFWGSTLKLRCSVLHWIWLEPSRVPLVLQRRCPFGSVRLWSNCLGLM